MAAVSWVYSPLKQECNTNRSDQSQKEDNSTLSDINGKDIATTKAVTKKGTGILERLKRATYTIGQEIKEIFAGFPTVLKKGGWWIALIGFLSGFLIPFLVPLSYFLLTKIRRIGRSHPGEDSETWLERQCLEATTCLMLLILTAVLVVSAVWLDCAPPQRGAILLLPTLFCVSALAGSMMLLSIQAIFDAGWHRIYRSRVNLCSGIFLYFMVGTFVLAILPGFIRAGSSWIIALIEAIILVVLRFWFSGNIAGATPSLYGSAGFKHKILNALMWLIIPLILLLALVGIGCFIIIGHPKGHPLATWPLVSLYGWSLASYWLWHWILPALAGFILLSCINYNRMSPHTFYRDRLSEAFLMTFVRCKPSGEGYEMSCARNAVEMPLSFLHGYDCRNKDICAARGPYLLINATLNLTAARDLSGFRRQSEMFLFSRCYTGSERTGYAPTEAYGEELTVARAMTVSGAAVTSVMGGKGLPGMSFICTILGLRLGFWLQHPCKVVKQGQKKIHFWGRWLFYELFRYTHARGDFVYLSDGGHNGDNLGILPLLVRRTKLIIASDAEQGGFSSWQEFHSMIEKHVKAMEESEVPQPSKQAQDLKRVHRWLKKNSHKFSRLERKGISVPRDLLRFEDIVLKYK